jgi:predicted lipoprotein with Yx(FWY)xxD motif
VKSNGIAVVLALVAVACSSGGSGASGPTSSTTRPADLATATLRVGRSPIGSVLTDADGHTLYEYVPNGKGATNQVPAADLAAWPPLVADGPVTLGTGLTATAGTAKQSNGQVWVTYNSRIVYRYSGDRAPGDVNGNAFGDVWYALTPAGEPVQS